MIHFGPEPEPEVSIIVVAWKKAPLLLACLQSVAQNVGDVAFEVMLVLNEPSPELEVSVDRSVAGARVFKFRSNLGFGGGVNVAAEAARGRFLVLLNDDSTVERGWLEALLETAARRPRAAMVGGTYLHPDGSLQEAGSVIWSDGTTSAFGEPASGEDWLFERKVDYCSGGSLLIRKDVWELLGGFDDRYYPAYFEDADLALRARDLGWEVWYQPLSVVRHVRSGSSGQLHAFLYGRSREQFLDRWGRRVGHLQLRGDFERAAWRAMGRPIRVLVLDDHLPDPAIGAGFGRMNDTLASLAADPGMHVAVHPTVYPRMDPAALTRIGVRVVSDLERHLDRAGAAYDVVVVSRPNNFSQLHDLLRESLPSARLIYDAEALFYRRLETRLELVRGTPEAARVEEEAAEIRRVEQRIFSAADAVVCISEEEADLVRAATEAPVHVVGAWLAAPTPTTAAFEQRSHIGLVSGWGSGSGTPNTAGLLWFAHEVLPRIRAAVPGCRLLVTGGDPPDDVSWLAGPAVRFVGHVQDLEAFYDRIRVVISPTRFGAGVKLKTVEAIQYGVPVIATLEAARGLQASSRAAVWATDDPAAFAEAVVAIYTDPDVWVSRREQQLAAAVRDRSGHGATLGWPEIIRDTVRGSMSSGGDR